MMMERALGVYEYWKTKLLFRIVKEDMTCVDIGVNKGYYSLLFAKLMNCKGKVLSFEPDPINCFWFKESIQANNYQCIKLYQCALSNDEGNALFYLGRKSGQGSLFSASHKMMQEQKTITVQTRKLDNVLKVEGLNSVDLIKIDVEGADLLVLKGAEQTLKNNRIQLVMDVDVKTMAEKRELFNLLHSCGFTLYSIGKKINIMRKPDSITKDIYAIKR